MGERSHYFFFRDPEGGKWVRGKMKIWKACSYLLEGNEELFMMVRVELEPAIKLSREIIQELQDSNRELQGSNKELQGDIKELHQRMEDSYRRLIEKSLNEGKSKEEIETDLMEIFALSQETARERMLCFKKENQNIFIR